MINYHILSGHNTEKMVHTLVVHKPLEGLSMICNLFEELDDFMLWLEELINRNLPDSSELGGILFQGILWGSNISTIVELDNLNKVDKTKEFETIDLLELCKQWKDFTKKNAD